ncbi:MAG: protein FlhF [Pseudomonadota bacterium]
MRPKVFQDTSIRAAMAKVKDELGPDAMILGSRRVPRSPKDPYGRELFEVEAVPRKSSGPQDSMEEITVRKPVMDTAGYDQLHQELASIRDLISLAALGDGVGGVLEHHREATGLYASLLRAGISEKNAGTILRKACSALEQDRETGTGSIAFLKKYVINECIGQIAIVDPFSRDSKKDPAGPRVAAFVGPTGVGKTTTIAKLAAELNLRRKLKVGLISIDSYRIGAFEQLRAYASIMGLMCVPAFSEADFRIALERMDAMDAVLIDTAGHSPWDKARMDEIAGVIRGGASRVSVHLVLSLTTGFLDMKQAVKAYADLSPGSYVFTKVDEAMRCGKIMDQIMEYGMPISLITNGQRVPEDLIVPDRKDILGIVLGTEPARGEMPWIRQAG